MINSEDVIKLEYTSVENDPWSVISNILLSNESGSSGLSDINIEEINSNEYHLGYLNNDNDEILPDSESNDPIDQEDTTKWYKQIDNDDKYVCKFCDSSYSTVLTLRYHTKIKHTSDYHELKQSTVNSICRNIIKCHFCKMTFEDITELISHSKTYHRKYETNICLVCYATFDEYSDALSHGCIRAAKKVYNCTMCSYSTPNTEHFKYHINLHTNPYKMKCYRCSYTTYLSSHLKIHEQTHLKDKPLHCKYEGCHYRCKTKAALRSHQLIHDKAKHMLYCDRCTYSTIYKQNLIKHMDSH